ncbi:uncharacterized protein LOC131597320 [Vicia villosa]|uniref:uncharacterized protein LOC131597320 n=1 Tax=Vicia villosa TaxID=3911 RepID=UPI00273B0A95|nr:uncharacterized protein LOC131597320 [Vicia villosa]
MPYAQLLPQFLANQLVQLRELGPPPDPLPPGYDANARCEFHSRAPGHTIEKCRALKCKVQDLIDDKIISFTPTGPNMLYNPMPPHAGTTNAIELCDEQVLVTDVDEIKMSLATVKERLMQQGVLHELHDFCLQCSSNPEECARLRDEIQKMMDEGILRVERVVFDEDVATLEIPYYPANVSRAQGTPLLIQALTTHLKHDYPLVGNPDDTNIAGTSGITRSGKIFAAPPPLPKETNKDVNAQTKGKQVFVDPPKSSTTQDAEQLLRIIKKSYYKVVDQLDQTQAKISIFSLLVHSEAHRNTLMKILGSAHVTQDITVPQFEGVVTNIAAGNCLGFCDDELPPEGRAYNKELHIFIRCLNTVLSRVLIYTGSSLNVIPKATLFKLSMDGVMMRPCTMSVRVFDGSRRSVEGEIDLPVKIGPYTFYIAFYCLKFIVSDKIVVITGEEDVVINNLTMHHYVEGDREMHETPFQALEIVSVDRFPVFEGKKKSEVPLSSLSHAKALLEAGVPRDAWGKVIDVREKQDKFGL